MAWGRLALVQAAGEGEIALDKTAKLFGYQPEAQQQKDTEPEGNPSLVGEARLQSIPLQNTKAIRPPAVFLRVNKFRQLENSDDAKPGYLSDKAMCLQAQPGTYSFAPPSPLLPMSRLIPFLHSSLGQARAVGKLDHRGLTKNLAEAKALKRLPYSLRQCWSQRLQIIIDASPRLEPYWADFAFIVSRLKKLLGEEAVESIRFDEDSIGSALCISWPTQTHDRWRKWQVPPVNMAILILSDLGVTDEHPSAHIRWQRFLKRFQAHPAPLLTLSPAAQSPANSSLCRRARPNPLNDFYNLPRHPHQNGFRLPEPIKSIDGFLALLSPLPVIDSGLLRRLRIALNWGGSELESQIWNHPDMYQTSLGIRLQESVAERYRRIYRQQWKGTQQAKDLWRIVAEHHAKAFEGLRQLEALNECVMEGADSQKVRDYYQSLCATLDRMKADQGSGSASVTALIGQCRTLLASRPETIWQSDLSDIAYDLYAMAHADDIRAGRWQDKLEPGFDPGKLQWLLDEHNRSAKELWQVVPTGGQAQFICRKLESDNDKALSIVKIEAQPTFPPIVHFADKSFKDSARAPQTFTSHKGILTIKTNFQQIELEAINRPSWAKDIGQNANGLFARIEWLGEEHVVFWSAGSADKGRWDWPSPFGEDQYGLYADFKFKDIVQRFRWIEPGTFLMGSPASEAERFASEIQHEVTLTQGYWLADTACTQALWMAVMGKNPSQFYGDLNIPVERVSWSDVQGFIQRLNQMSLGLKARLPTEAQWEYACRAGTRTPFSFGDNITPEQVNYNGDHPYAGGAKGGDRGKTVPVKSMPANPWGLFEMHGNVWEWCQDWLGNYGPEALTDPVGPDSGSFRVMRGGSWHYGGRRTRSADRGGFDPDYRVFYIGFRLALG